MKIQAIDTYKLTLPFRFSFGHSLSTRNSSTNLFVKVTLTDGTEGFGEGVPRDYVTGENIEAAQENVVSSYAPRLIGLDVSDKDALAENLKNIFFDLRLDRLSQGASWCALELAVLDAAARACGVSVADWFGPVCLPKIHYGGVVPFAGKKALIGMLLFYKLCGYRTVKIKIGKDIQSDRWAVSQARKIMGPRAIIRVDANCAWTADQAIAAAEVLRPFKVASFEQPVRADDLPGLKKLTAAIHEDVVVDESLCTLAQAKLLAEEKLCDAFNIRLSKVGGFLVARSMVEIASRAGLACHLGAQVGESGVLSAAARVFALVNKPFENYEGSANAFLLSRDLTNENLTAGFAGAGDLGYAAASGTGFGVTVRREMLGAPSGNRGSDSLERPFKKTQKAQSLAGIDPNQKSGSPG